jgi:hypothetical protein
MRSLVACVFVASALAAAIPARTVEAQATGGGPCCQGSNGGGDSDGGTISSWVVGATDGGVSPPSGTSSCGPWKRGNAGTFESPDGADTDVQSVLEIDGEEWLFWYRDCDGTVQAVWAPDYSPEDLARVALAEVERLIPPPNPSTLPTNDVGGFVTLETWLQVEATAPLAATAGPLPNGLTATTTATPVAIEWLPGDSETGTISCELWGAIPTDEQLYDGVAAPCGWTPPGPSAPQYGAGADLRFHGTIWIVWDVAWTATNGTGDTLGQIRSETDWSYRVREIQTIGEDR